LELVIEEIMQDKITLGYAEAGEADHEPDERDLLL